LIKFRFGVYAFQDQPLCVSIVLNQTKEKRLEDSIEAQYLFFFGGGAHSPAGGGLRESQPNSDDLRKAWHSVYSVVSINCLTGKFSFAILIGHNHERSSNFFSAFCTFDNAVFIIKY
jgi:hypothetical protein